MLESWDLEGTHEAKICKIRWPVVKLLNIA
jgi:hypothetical protein